LELFNFDGCAPNSIKKWVGTTEKWGGTKKIYYHHCAPPLLKSFRRLWRGLKSGLLDGRSERGTVLRHLLQQIDGMPCSMCPGPVLLLESEVLRIHTVKLRYIVYNFISPTYVVAQHK